MADQQQQVPSTFPTSNTDSNIASQRPPFLRRCSISDPHLDILPHFPQDKATHFNPFNRVLSGLFEGSAFSLNKLGTSSTESIDKEGHQNHRTSQEHLAPTQPKAGSSAFELKNTYSPATITTPVTGLRKSATSISALFGSSPQHQHFPTIPETEDQGLIMSARPNTASFNNEKSNSQANAADAARSPQKAGGIMKMLGGGFLTRPAMYSPEENYRYIMALDR